jgi:hypothetical protein
VFLCVPGSISFLILSTPIDIFLNWLNYLFCYYVSTSVLWRQWVFSISINWIVFIILIYINCSYYLIVCWTQWSSSISTNLNWFFCLWIPIWVGPFWFSIFFFYVSCSVLWRQWVFSISNNLIIVVDWIILLSYINWWFWIFWCNPIWFFIISIKDIFMYPLVSTITWSPC